MTKLAQKLQEATAGSTELENELRVDIEDGSGKGSEIPVQEVFSYLVKGVILWLCLQFYFYLTTSLPAFENYIDSKIASINSVVRREIKASGALTEILPVPTKKNALSADSFRELIRNPTAAPGSLLHDQDKNRIRRH